jgi:hypothetical protein
MLIYSNFALDKTPVLPRSGFPLAEGLTSLYADNLLYAMECTGAGIQSGLVFCPEQIRGCEREEVKM